MKKIVLTFALVLGLSSASYAAVQEFKDVKADIPEGWQVQEQGPMVLVVAPSNDAMVSIMVAPADGMNAKQIAESGSKSVSGSPVKDEGNGKYSFTFESQGQKGKMLVMEKGGKGLVVTSAGQNPALDGIANSAQFK